MTILILYKTKEFADGIIEDLTRWRSDIRVCNSLSRCTISSQEICHRIVKYSDFNVNERGTKHNAIYLEDGVYELLTQEQLMRLRMSYVIPYKYGNVKTLEILDLLNKQ